MASSQSVNGRIAVVVIAYLAFYSLASFLDLSTTVLALKGSGTHEGNVFSTNSQGYLLARALSITTVAAIVMAGCVIFAVRNAARVDDVWIKHPVRSFGLFYLNPWARAAISRSPIHMLSLAIAFAVLRILAAGNNLMIHFFGIAPIGAPIDWISKRSSPIIGFTVVIVVLFYALSVALSPVAAKLISSWAKQQGLDLANSQSEGSI
jgi:hypothetical protein